ncbi:MAG: hypothetical protein ABIH59_01160 [archaeon]
MENKIYLILFGLILFPIVSGQNISVNYDEEVNVNEEFKISIELIDFPEDTYDIKIDIIEDETRIAKILNNDVWKSTFYYINDVIESDQKKKFSLKVNNYVGNAEILIKIRDSSEKTKSFGPYEIEITDEPLEKIIDEKDEQDVKEEIELEEPREEQVQELSQKDPVTFKTVSLSPQTIKTKENLESSSKKSYIISGVLAFFILIAIFFVLRQKKYKENEFRE